MKKILFIIIICLFLSGCGTSAPTADGRIQIVASLFPQYDFAREICGDKANISLLLPAGTDSHAYEPTPSDIVKIGNADLFLYTGDDMEPWASRLTENVSGTVVDVSVGAVAITAHHDSTSPHSHDVTEPHIWTNPQNAMIMTENILEAVCIKDAENADFYRQNAAEYIEKLKELDSDFETVVQASARKTIYFGGHFALRHFTERYGLSYVAAFDSCAGEAEPSASVLTEMINKMKRADIPAIYYEELSTPRAAEMIAAETGAKMLLFHSCHNISSTEVGETYLSLMKKNLENLKIGLN